MGHITPPVGLCLFIGCSIAEMGIDEVLRGLLPFILIMVIGVAIIVLWPSLVLFIPRAFGFI
jgi:C4-dicarboxylate transporter DctM subunit